MPPRTALDGIPTGDSATPKPHQLGEAGPSHKSGSLSDMLAALISEPETNAFRSAETLTGLKSAETPKPHPEYSWATAYHPCQQSWW